MISDENISIIEEYLDAFFGSPQIATLFAILAIIYTYYLYKKSNIPSRLLFISMSNGKIEKERRTELIIINQGKDITPEMVIGDDGLVLSVSKSLKLKDIRTTYNSNENGKFYIKKLKKNNYRLKFNILKKNQSVVIKLLHHSQSHADETWKEIFVQGTIIDHDIARDDFSDQIIRRVNQIEPFSIISILLATVVLTYILNLIIDIFYPELNVMILMTASLLISMLIVPNLFLNMVGNREYKLCWKYLKESRKRQIQ